MKYGNTKVKYGGEVFDSKAERDRYRDLLLLQKAGKITDLERQKKFLIIPAQPGEREAVYTADFVYCVGEQKVAEEVKGVASKDYPLRRKLFKLKFPDYDFVEIHDGEVTSNSRIHRGKK